jgi:hypothetical protein
LEGNVSVRAVSERGVREFGQVHAPFEAIRCLQEIPTINQYRYSLHVSCSSEIVGTAIADVQMSICRSRPLWAVQSQILLSLYAMPVPNRSSLFQLEMSRACFSSLGETTLEYKLRPDQVASSFSAGLVR